LKKIIKKKEKSQKKKKNNEKIEKIPNSKSLTPFFVFSSLKPAV